MRNKYITFLSRIIDVILAPIFLVIGPTLFIYRRLGSWRMPLSTKMFKINRVFPIIKHYYEPQFEFSDIKEELKAVRNLPGIDLNISKQLDFLSSLCYTDEILNIDLRNAQIENDIYFNIENGSFESGDAEFLYQFIRKTKPNKIVEIGSGNSTKIIRLAILNSEDSYNPTHVCYEPYEMPWLEFINGVDLRREKIENSKTDWAKELKPGDFLFIDSTHMIRPHGDVLFEYLEILPSLAQGIFVHIHDIFTPRNYPINWLEGTVRFWNEQYLLEALISKSNSFEVISALNFLKNEFYEELIKVCPYLTTDREPASFYIKTK